MLKAERKGLVSAPQVTQDDRDPVVRVSWQDTKDFTAWILSLRNEHIRVVTANTSAQRRTCEQDSPGREAVLTQDRVSITDVLPTMSLRRLTRRSLELGLAASA